MERKKKRLAKETDEAAAALTKIGTDAATKPAAPSPGAAASGYAYGGGSSQGTFPLVY